MAFSNDSMNKFEGSFENGDEQCSLSISYYDEICITFQQKENFINYIPSYILHALFYKNQVFEDQVQ